MKNRYIPQVKAFAFFCLLTLFSFTISAQVGIGTTNPDPGSVLDISSADKGVLLPRVNITNLSGIAPLTGGTEGMLVYNTNTTTGPGFFYWSGTSWVGVSDGNGTEAWDRIGNAGTNASNNFIGTTDNQPLAFRVNDTERMGILTNGNVGMGGYYTNVKLNVSGGTNTIGINASTNNTNGYGIFAMNENASSSTGIVGIGNNSGTFMTGFPGTGIAGTAAGNGYGVMGAHFNGTNGDRFGVLGSPDSGIASNFSATNYGWMNSSTEGLYTQRNDNNYVALAHRNGNTSYGIYTAASGNTYNAGLYVASGETVISAYTGSGPQLSRTWNGSIFLQRAGGGTIGGRIYFRVGNVNYYVNSSNYGDYSEYFKTSDRTLGVGEIVAMDPSNASGVRRARPSDISKTVGIVSIGGTRNNDNIGGTRGEDLNYVNVGLLGQVPVLVTTENGNIKPGDPLTLSKTYRGRAVKATESCRIIGYALTSFPYVSGEQSYETDINGTDKLKLRDNHVMCYVNPVWYEPADENLGDGIEILPSESAFNMATRVNRELENENPNKGVIRDRPNYSIERKNMVPKTVENSSLEKLEDHQSELKSTNETTEVTN